jgi:hypothetical protein
MPPFQNGTLTVSIPTTRIHARLPKGHSGQARIENEMARLLTVSALPEGNEVEDLVGFVTFAQVGIGIAKRAAGGVLSQGTPKILGWRRLRADT